MHKTQTLVGISVVLWNLVSVAAAQAPCRTVEIDRLGARAAYVYDLNNWGQVVGSLTTSAEGQASQTQPFVWELGRTRLLESPTPVSEARALNGLGRIVGSLYEADGKVVPVTWTRGRIARLASSQQAIAVDVNNRGQIVGYNSLSRGVLWQNSESQPIDLGTLGGAMCQPSAINDHGIVVGVSVTADNTPHGFVWEDGVFTDIGLPDHPDAAIEIVRTELVDINDDGLAVGYAYAAEGGKYPLLWTRERGARVSSTPIVATTVNSFGTVAALSPDSELLLGGYARPFRSRGAFADLDEFFVIAMNDRYQLAFSARREGVWVPFFCQLTP
jgi:probable HAF family extracellular repeat protein